MMKYLFRSDSMSNHGPNPFQNFDDEDKPQFQQRNERLRSLLDVTGFSGATGQFPEPKLQPTDEGEIQFTLGEKDGKVVIDFGTSVHWLAMTPQQAAEFASAVLKKAKEAWIENGETVSFVLG